MCFVPDPHGPIDLAQADRLRSIPAIKYPQRKGVVGQIFAIKIDRAVRSNPYRLLSQFILVDSENLVIRQKSERKRIDRFEVAANENGSRE